MSLNLDVIKEEAKGNLEEEPWLCKNLNDARESVDKASDENQDQNEQLNNVYYESSSDSNSQVRHFSLPGFSKMALSSDDSLICYSELGSENSNSLCFENISTKNIREEAICYNAQNKGKARSNTASGFIKENMEATFKDAGALIYPRGEQIISVNTRLVLTSEMCFPRCLLVGKNNKEGRIQLPGDGSIESGCPFEESVLARLYKQTGLKTKSKCSFLLCVNGKETLQKSLTIYLKAEVNDIEFNAKEFEFNGMKWFWKSWDVLQDLIDNGENPTTIDGNLTELAKAKHIKLFTC